jgi:hypothetical protein
MKLMQQGRMPGLTHRICEHCKVRMMRQIERTLVSRRAG